MEKILFAPVRAQGHTFKNKMVMAPMTRSRAVDKNTPNDMMVKYYSQRAGAGLIITEGTSPSANGLGYVRIPGIYTPEQIAGWKKVTEKVHADDGKIFLQLMHTGRITHELNLPKGAKILAPSAVAAKSEMYTDEKGMQPLPVPEAMSAGDVKTAIEEYVQAAKNAIVAGFDGVEFHAANGYLIEQFINPVTNVRADNYGGSVENRSRFLLEIAEKTVAAIGKENVGVRISPYGAFNDMPAYDEVDETYTHITQKLNDLGVLYLHLLDHSSMGTPPVPHDIKIKLKHLFKGKFIICGGFDAEKAENILQKGEADFIAFGRPFLANPDLVQRYETGAELNEPDQATFYAPGEKGFEQGYTDYPILQEA